MCSLNVYPHWTHLKNWVDDSSEPRVCTSHTFAVVLPHLGQSIWIVGIGFKSTSLSITATNCLGSCWMTLGTITFSGASGSDFFAPHLVQVNIINAWFPEWILTGFSREPHSLQNSICFISKQKFFEPFG